MTGFLQLLAGLGALLVLWRLWLELVAWVSRADRSGPCPCGRLTHRQCVDTIPDEGGCLDKRVRFYDDVHRDVGPGEESPPAYHVRRVAPAVPRILHATPGPRLDAHASAALLRTVFGDDPPR